MRRNCRGSLLIEALLSIVLLSISITLIIQSLTGSLRATVYNADYTKACFLAENKMTELIQQGFIESGLSDEREFEEPFNDFSYTLETTANAKDSEKLNEIHLNILWKSGQKENRLTLQTFLFNPEE